MAEANIATIILTRLQISPAHSVVPTPLRPSCSSSTCIRIFLITFNQELWLRVEQRWTDQSP